MMIDFALDAERNEGKTPRDAIYQACLLRFRPILMTTMAAMLGALPLMLGTGVGSELRHPLGIAIVGGLIVSQVLTLFTTPVIYLFFDRLGAPAAARDRVRRLARGAGAHEHLRALHRRPVATTLLTIGIALAGALAFSCCRSRRCRRSIFRPSRCRRSCPAPARKPWRPASPTPLERHLGADRRRHRDDLVEQRSARRASRCSSISTATSTAPRATCRPPSTPRAPICRPACATNPTYRKVNPADAPIMILALTSTTLTRGQIYDAASNVLQQQLSQVERRRPGRSSAARAARGARRTQSRARCSNTASAWRTCAPRSPRPTPTARKAPSRTAARSAFRSTTNDQATRPPTMRRWSSPTATAPRCELSDVAEVVEFGRGPAQRRAFPTGSPAVLVILFRQPGANIIDTVDRRQGRTAASGGGDAGRRRT